MANIIFITGGQRSGKSSYAQRLAEQMDPSPIYLATARVWDEEFKARIRRHQSDRDERWETLEEEKALSRLNLTGRTVLLDCVTLWLTNIFHDNHYELNASLAEAKQEWSRFIDQEMTLIVVSNEIGMGVIPADETTRRFVDLQGWMNQQIASTAQQAFAMFSGRALELPARKHF